MINGLGQLGDEDDPAPDPWTPELFQDLRDSGLSAVNLTVGHVYGAGEPFETTVADIARHLRLIRAHPREVALVQSAAELRDGRSQGRVGLILGFQNTLMLGDRPGRVELFAGLGVKVIQLTYNGRNRVGDGAMEAGNRGLTRFGREVLAELNRTGTLLDLSHSGERTCLEAIAASGAPATLSHVGCQALHPHPRNKSDRELRLLAERGGVAGIYFMPYLRADSQPTAADVVAHLEHAIQVCGEDHVALGTDGGSHRVADLEVQRRAAAEDVARRQAAGIAAPGEQPGVLPFVPDLCGPDQFRRLVALLEARGHGGARIEKILGGNLLRLYAEVWGG